MLDIVVNKFLEGHFNIQQNVLTWKLKTYTYEKCKGAVLEMASCVLEIKYSVTTSYKDSINVLFPTTHAEIQTVFSAKEIF